MATRRWTDDKLSTSSEFESLSPHVAGASLFPGGLGRQDCTGFSLVSIVANTCHTIRKPEGPRRKQRQNNNRLHPKFALLLFVVGNTPDYVRSKPSRGNKNPSLHPQKPYLSGFKGHFESHFLHV